jgi:hypothetical protein
MATKKRFTNATGSPVADNTNNLTAGPHGPAPLLADRDDGAFRPGGDPGAAHARQRPFFQHHIFQ